MASRFNLKSNLSKMNSAPMTAKSNVFLGLSLASLMVVLLLKWIPALAMTLPIFGISALGYWLWTEFQQDQDQRQKRQARVDAKFYRLLRQQQGRISVLDFAMHAQLTGPAAQAYLNRQAQTFSAYIDTAASVGSTGMGSDSISAPGNLVYVFELTGLLMDLSGSDVNTAVGDRGPSQVEAVWAIAEQTRRQQARANQAQAAWANAKQIRTLHQLSRREAAAGPTKIRQMDDGFEQRLTALPSAASSAQQPSAQKPSAQKPSAQKANSSQPTPIQAGYIAISTIDSQGKEQGSYPNRVGSAQGDSAQPKAPTRTTDQTPKRRHGNEAFTIDVPAIRG